ncbi:MAG: MAE_28990/MAE_18760 family HEPN-like nuclease [Saprospiraceae bacterium]|nr:MAE_28990/MAE_18760 family HEPN-like nuclease [Saprospiraceae bacterium]
MNTTSLGNFSIEINQIREYLRHIKHIDAIIFYTINETDSIIIKELIANLKSNYRTFGTDKKIFEYKAVVITLYGILEKYTESWIKEFLDELANLVTDYNKIDDKIKNCHFDLSIKLINTISSKELAKFQHINKEKILSNLNRCITEPNNYKFNTDAFILSSGNLKHAKITEMLSNINISLNDGLKKSQSLIQYLQSEFQKEGIANQKGDALYFKINDLVDRRNIIAHGADVIDDLLDSSILESYIDFLEVYCKSIFETFRQELISKEILTNYVKIKVIRNVWRKSIIGFEIENYTLKINDIIIVETSSGYFLKKPILEIQVNDITYSVLEIKDKIDVAIRVDPVISSGQSFYIAKTSN